MNRLHRAWPGREEPHWDYPPAEPKVYARLVAADDKGVTAYTRWCSYRARQAVAENWLAICRFAHDLLENG